MTDTTTTPEVVATPAPATLAAPAEHEGFILKVEEVTKEVGHDAVAGVEDVVDWAERFWSHHAEAAKTYQAKN